MKPCPHDGVDVLHVDCAGVQHSGVVVGQSDDGKWIYIKADSDLPGAWDMSVKYDMMPVLLKNAKKLAKS